MQKGEHVNVRLSALYTTPETVLSLFKHKYASVRHKKIPPLNEGIEYDLIED